MADFKNPFRPGAGHQPPYLAGRDEEKREFRQLLEQEPILENLVLTGLRGVGKTVLLDLLKPMAIEQDWLWVGTDLSESASMSEENLAIRLCTDLAPTTSNLVVATETVRKIGFAEDDEKREYVLDYEMLRSIYTQTPGLSLDKVQSVLEAAWLTLSRARGEVRGLIFAYDEAQTLADHVEKEEFPLALLLDAFQSLQRKGLPLMLVLTGLPTLFPKLVEARTFAERMFRVVFLESLNAEDSRNAILKPIEDAGRALRLNDATVEQIIEMSGGYPYFIQFICREVYDAFISRLDKGLEASVPVREIEQKLDTDFFAGRWSRATDRQRDLLTVVARLPNADEEFTVQEIVDKSEELLDKPFSNSHTNQILSALSKQGLVFKNRHGRYLFAVPLLGQYILRQIS